MTAKEKAEEIVDRFYQKSPEIFGTSKSQYFGIDMALICVDEIIKAEPSRKRKTLTMVGERKIMVSNKSYWKRVKQEINKL